MTALTMVFKLCQSASKKWRRLDGSHQIADIIQGVKFKDGEKLTERARLKPASPTFDNSSGRAARRSLPHIGHFAFRSRPLAVRAVLFNAFDQSKASPPVRK